MAVGSNYGKGTPQAQLKSFIDAFDAKDQKLIRALRTAIRKRLPGANELVYDYTAFFVIGYSPTDKAIEGILSIAARANDVRLYFMHGKTMPDPKKLLKGAGSTTRFVQIESTSQLSDPDVKALIAAQLQLAKAGPAFKGKGKIEIRSLSKTGKPPPRKKK